MSLVRFLARSLVAGAFISDGIKKATSPDESAPEAEAFTSTVAPLVQRVAPAGYSSHIPEDARTWVRYGGIAEIIGGLMFATGLGRRIGALLLANASVLNVAIAYPGKDASTDDKKAARPELFHHLALLGATILASQDLQGRPSLAWRASHTAERAGKEISGTTEDLSKRARKTATKAEKRAQKLASKARKEARKVAKKLER